MKKKFVTLFVAAALVCSIGGCGGKSDTDISAATAGDAAIATEADGTQDSESNQDTAGSEQEAANDKQDTTNGKPETSAPTNASDNNKPTTDANKPSTQAFAPGTEAPTTQASASGTQAPAAQTPGTEEPATAHQHTWKTVVDKEAYDEPVYEVQDVYEYHDYWPDGTYADELADGSAKQRWCMLHCTSCNPECSDPDPAGRCAFSILWGPVYVGTEKVQTGTRHHDAVTHQECTTCGARK